MLVSTAPSGKQPAGSGRQRQASWVMRLPKMPLLQRSKAVLYMIPHATFFCVSRAAVLSATAPLPHLQRLLADGWLQDGRLQKKDIYHDAAFRQQYVGTYLAVSHRWEFPDKPDKDGEQLREIQAHLRETPAVKWVWHVRAPRLEPSQPIVAPRSQLWPPLHPYNHTRAIVCKQDHWCLFQDEKDESGRVVKPKTRYQAAAFDAMLRGSNLLYLGMSVLILLDRAYMGRFWTQLEAWLSMQDTAAGALRPASEESRRCSIRLLRGCSAGYRQGLVEDWATRNPKQAYDVLSAPDISITNGKDKEKMLPKVLKLEKAVGEALKARKGLLSRNRELDRARSEQARREKALEDAERRAALAQKLEKAVGEALKARKGLLSGNRERNRATSEDARREKALEDAERRATLAQQEVAKAKMAVEDAKARVEQVKATMAQQAEAVLSVDVSVKLHERAVSGRL